jgi:beta-phosphoglucomutase-like phosphatase (HAD superfamily)
METQKVHLKLAKKHPKDAFKILDIAVVGYAYKPYNITEAHAEELMSPAGKAWVKCKEIEEDEAEESEEFSEESDIVDPTEEELEALKKAEEIKAQSESVNDPAPTEAPAELQEDAKEFIDETEVIEDKPKSKKNK